MTFDTIARIEWRARRLLQFVREAQDRPGNASAHEHWLDEARAEVLALAPLLGMQASRAPDQPVTAFWECVAQQQAPRVHIPVPLSVMKAE